MFYVLICIVNCFYFKLLQCGNLTIPDAFLSETLLDSFQLMPILVLSDFRCVVKILQPTFLFSSCHIVSIQIKDSIQRFNQFIDCKPIFLEVKP